MKARILALILPIFPLVLSAASLMPTTLTERAADADAVGTAKLVFSYPMKTDETVRTKFIFRTEESLSGNLPDYFEVIAQGGIYDNLVQADSRLPELTTGTVYTLFLQIERETLGFYEGVAGAVKTSLGEVEELRQLFRQSTESTADLSRFEVPPFDVGFAVSSTGLLDSGSGFRRFTQQDRGEPIQVLADISTRPAGVSKTQALDVLRRALDAWEAVSTLHLEVVGTETFNKSADEYGGSKTPIIRVQFHDNFHKINSTATLGFGGSGYYTYAGDGATINGRAFHAIASGYVVLDHPKGALSNLATLEEVVAHEIGHVIGLAHSSEDPRETNFQLKESLMYYMAKADGRGAVVNGYDSNTIQRAYPMNAPPAALDSYLHVVTSSSGNLLNPEVNQTKIAMFDLNNDPLTLQIVSTTAKYGVFTKNGTTITYKPSGLYGDTSVANPETSSYDRLIGRVSDGVNWSPFFEVRVVGFRSDTYPAIPDGIPDAWMTEHFGSPSRSTSDADPDGDGLDNKTEYLLGLDPNDRHSTFQISEIADRRISLPAQAYGNYLVEISHDLKTWKPERVVQHTGNTDTLVADNLPASTPEKPVFLRVKHMN